MHRTKRLIQVLAVIASAAGCGGGGGGTPATDSGIGNGPDLGTPCDPLRYTTTTDTVVDSTTGLTWQRSQAPGFYTHANAITYCAGLGLGGLTWHLPTLTELQSIVVLGASPTIDSCAFPFTGKGWYWTSTIAAGSTWPSKVYFALGNAGADDPTATYPIRCVH